MSLRDEIIAARQRIQDGELENERLVWSCVVEPILRSLNWNTNSSAQVFQELPIGRRKVDYALRDGNRRPLVLIETKAHNKIEEKSRDQLFEYAYAASREGVGITLLTDGQRWEFYLAQIAGARAEERLFYELDLVNAELDRCEDRLFRYLNREYVYNKEAFEVARKHFEKRREEEERVQQEKRDRDKLENSLPRIWKELVEDSDSSLYELVSRKVVDAGLKEHPQIIAGFISKLRGLGQMASTNESPSQRPQTAYVSKRLPSISPKKANSTTTPRRKIVGYTLYGRRYDTHSWRGALIGVFNEFIARDPEFVANLKRTYPRYWTNRKQLIADRQDEVYLKSPHLINSAHQLNSGQWIDTHLSQEAIESRLKDACEVMRLQYGVDLRIHE